MGATIFAQASILLAGDYPDHTRVAAQVVAGIGFLGAGAIIHERRAVSGLTTAASIWAVAAIGLVVGAGFAVAGMVLSLLIFLILIAVRAFEKWLAGPCRFVTARIRFRPENGRTHYRLQGILDDHHVAGSAYRFIRPADASPAGPEELELRYCAAHRVHRDCLSEISTLGEVVEISE
jgi:putative Mg2+ transporter-C (MgtC) family protein